MNLNVTQENLYLFLPSKVSWMAYILADQNNNNIVDAIKEIYSSQTYKQLETESTKLWNLGPVALCQIVNCL